MSTARFTLVCSLLLVVSSATASAQVDKVNAPSPAVTISVSEQGVRFISLSGVKQTRLEVFNEGGDSLFNSGFQPGTMRDWALRDQQGWELPDGAYLCVVTVRDLSGRLSVKQGTVLVRGGQPSLQLGEGEQVGNVEPEQSLSPVADGAETAVTLTAHDGGQGQLVSTRGGLAFRAGDFFAGKDKELMRLTPDGDLGVGVSAPAAKLDVDGAVRASEGFRFADGTTLDSAGGRLTLRNAEGDPLPAPSAAGTGTQNRLAKWAVTGGAGTLTDSAVFESGGNVGVGTTAPEGMLHIQSPNTTVLKSVTSGTVSTGRSVFQMYRGAAANSNGWDFGYNVDLGSENFILRELTNAATTTRLTIRKGTGNVGVGVNAPTQKLDVGGNIKLTGAGNGIIFPDGTTQLTASSTVASDIACTGCVSEAELSFSPATGAELAAHRASGDHDSRYPLLGHHHDVSEVTNGATLGANSFSGDQNVAGNFDATGTVSGGSASFRTNLSVGNQTTGGTIFSTNTVNRFVEIGSNVNFDSFGTAPGLRLRASDAGQPNTWGVILGDGDGHFGSFIIRQDDMSVPGGGFARNRFIIASNGDVIVNSGRLGVGTESPSARLDVVGDARASGNVTAASFTGDGSGLTNVNAAGSLSGVVPTTNGGTGLSSAGAAGGFLRSDGSSWTSALLTAADVPAGSAGYIQNTTSQQPDANFNVGGNGTVGGTLSANSLNAATHYNIAGNKVLAVNDTSTFLGLGAGQSLTGADLSNTFFGANTGLALTSGSGNAFFGESAGRSGATAVSFNSFFGQSAGRNNTGSDNSFFGVAAGLTNTGGRNSFFGGFAGISNTSGQDNAYLGYYAGSGNATGNNNAAVGLGAGGSTSGSNNSFFGSKAGDGISNIVGDNNTFVGFKAGFSNATSPVSSSDNTYVGFSAGGAANISNATAVGAHAQVTQENSLVLGSISGRNGATADTNVGIGTTAPAERLEVVGNVRISGAGRGLIFPDGTTMTTAPPSNPTATNLNCAGCVSEAELDFNPATQAELDAHNTSGAHDARYVGQTGGTMTGALRLPSDGLNVGGSELTVAAGNVGIGTASPAAKLDVEGVARLRYLIATPQDAGLEGGEVSLQGAPSFHSWQMDNYGGNFRLHNQGLTRFEMTPAGNVGLGIVPTQKLEVVGNVRINGNFVATGSKSAVVTLPDNREVALYAVESPGNWFEDFGHATLRSGVAQVELDATFAQTVNTETTYHVFITPTGNCNGLYVARKTATGFEVRELGGGQTNVAFDYRIVARRKGYENVTSRTR